jgi:hypothetical protein
VLALSKTRPRRVPLEKPSKFGHNVVDSQLTANVASVN